MPGFGTRPVFHRRIVVSTFGTRRLKSERGSSISRTPKIDDMSSAKPGHPTENGFAFGECIHA